jgi:hypothetical protein
VLDGGTRVECIVACVGGRAPAGLLAAHATSSGDSLGRFFAAQAHLEAASVPAFERLRDELAAHGAPAHLVRAAARAILDEKRHARMTAAIARRHGSGPAPVELCGNLPQVRDLEAIAIENAVEGCVRETWGALLATYQARAAADARVRTLMQSIAPDETRHAELAWAVARFAEPRLSRAARARVRDARRAALADVERAAAVEPSAPLVTRAGLPNAAAARALSRSFRMELGARA